jgi:hypothetical protein
MSEIFISYASADRPAARMLAEALEQRGWDVWWDREIPLGKTFDEVIEQSIARAKCVIVLWSAASVASEWVRSEASEGRRRNMLLPAFIEAVEPPLAFRLLNGADLTAWVGGGSDVELERLVQRAKELLGTPSESSTTARAPVRPRVPVNGSAQIQRWRTPLIVLAIVLLALGAGLGGYWINSPERERDREKKSEDASRPNDLGIGDAQKNFNEVLKALGGAIPATSLAKGFHVPDLGVRMAYLSQEQSASTLGAMPAGAVVMEVESGRPIAKAGIHVGDVILSIGGSKIASEDDLRQAIFKIGAGRTAYSFRRGEETKTVNVDCPTCKAE